MNNGVNNSNNQTVNTSGTYNTVNPNQTLNTVNTQPQPVITNTTPVMTNVNPLPVVNQVGNDKKEENHKKKGNLFPLFLIIIFLLIALCGFLWFYHQQEMKKMILKCTPVSTTSGSKELDLDSAIVVDLYSKVETNLREDLGEVQLNDQLKLYLAYRQIARSKFYESHCNMFKSTGMEPFTCDTHSSFIPLAFKEETLQLEVKKLFGNDVSIPNQNIQLGNTCIGGFQYIPERGEYVQGECLSTGATLYRAEKELIGATSNESTIVLTERVKYYGSEGLEVPERLVSGTYKYTFKLDMNYNYVYVSKELVR